MEGNAKGNGSLVVEVGASDSVTPEEVAEGQRPSFPDLLLPR